MESIADLDVLPLHSMPCFSIVEVWEDHWDVTKAVEPHSCPSSIREIVVYVSS